MDRHETARQPGHRAAGIDAKIWPNTLELNSLAGDPGCYTAIMNEWASFIALAALIIGLFAWQRQDIKMQGDQLREGIKDQSEHIDKLNDRLGQVEQGLAALKATVETFFRLRVDPPDPDLDPDPNRHRTGTDG